MKKLKIAVPAPNPKTTRPAAKPRSTIARASRSSDQLQLRFTNTVPTLSLVMVDGRLPSGTILVEMVPYGKSAGLRPHLLLSVREHPRWFAYFREVAEDTFRDAIPARLPEARQTDEGTGGAG